ESTSASTLAIANSSSTSNLVASTSSASNERVFTSARKTKSSDVTEAVKRFNNRSDDNNDKFELLDPDSDIDESSEGELIESDNENEAMELSESESEFTTESDTDSEKILKSWDLKMKTKISFSRSAKIGNSSGISVKK
ncbi:10582_t:CDS:2, partial [Racocetra fulgida]